MHMTQSLSVEKREDLNMGDFAKSPICEPNETQNEYFYNDLTTEAFQMELDSETTNKDALVETNSLELPVSPPKGGPSQVSVVTQRSFVQHHTESSELNPNRRSPFSSPPLACGQATQGIFHEQDDLYQCETSTSTRPHASQFSEVAQIDIGRSVTSANTFGEDGHEHHAAPGHAYMTTGSFSESPITQQDLEHERAIIENFNALSSNERRMEILDVFLNQHIHPFERNRSFTADTWDEMKRVEAGDKCCDFRLDRQRFCLYITIFRRRYRFFFFSFVVRLFVLFLFWVLMYCLVSPKAFSPGGVYFDTITTVAFAGFLGYILSRVTTVPPIVCVIVAGILYNNIPSPGFLTSGITLTMKSFIGMFGVTIGLTRAGLSLNVIRFKQKFKHYVLFSLLPLLSEAAVHGVLCKTLYGYPDYLWAMTQGFTVSAIAPSVLVPVVIDMQRQGYGTHGGPALMMLSSIALETSLCTLAVQLLLALQFNTMSTSLIIALAPLQILVGLLGGVALGGLAFIVVFYVFLMEAERIPVSEGPRKRMTVRHSIHVRYLSVGFIVLSAFAFVAVGKITSCLGGAAIGVVTIAGAFNFFCVRGGTPEHLSTKADVSQTLTTVWDYVAMPALFGIAGANVNLGELFDRNFIGYALAVVLTGMFARFLAAMVSPMITRLGLSWSEILFCGIGWLGKGSVQSAFGATAMLFAQLELEDAKTPEEVMRAQERVELGRKLKNTAVLSVLIACPLCSIFLMHSKKLLKPDAVVRTG